MSPADRVVAEPVSIDRVLDLYRTWGLDHYDEEISQLDHALQTAALARHAGASDELVVASLLHDVGHLLDLERSADGEAHPRQAPRRQPDDADLAHEATGARYLAPLFPPSVTAPIALHVRAKRYRCAVDRAYADGLSAGSTRSLVQQGGPMTPDEAAAFERLPGFGDAVALRGWDDGGKVDGLEVPPLDDYRALLERVAGDG
jgi:phosphonate degradation associated HDIG domain protein